MYKYIKLIITIVAIITLSSCEDRNSLSAPAPINLGDADFSRFFTIGNSLTAGYQNGSLYQTSQQLSFGKMIADRVGATFEQPLYSDPGTIGRVEISGFDNNGDPILVVNEDSGEPINLEYQGIYNNLGVPGAVLYDLLNATNSQNCVSGSLGSPNPFFDLVLRNEQLNMGTQISQLTKAQPTIVTAWAGNNDALGYCLSGGTIPFTPEQSFTLMYNQFADSLSATGADIFVANIPEVTSVAYLSTIGPKIGKILNSSQSVENIYLYGDDEPYNGNDLDSLRGMITLESKDFVQYIGHSTGKPYLDDEGVYNIPADVDTTKAFAISSSNPWPNQFSLTESEIEAVNGTVNSYNLTIASIAQEHGFTLVDVNALFNDIADGGLVVDGINFTTAFITGNLFSFDGVHPTSQGYGVVANQFIKAINEKYNAEIPLINVSTIPGSLPLAEL